MVRRRASLRGVLSSLHRIFALHQLVIIAIVLSLSSCYNEPEFIGGNLIPDGDLASVKTDTTFLLSAHTIELDSVNASNTITNRLSYGLVGYLENPIFGSVKSEFLAEIIPSAYWKTKPLFGVSPTPDSVCLYFYFNKAWGNKALPTNIKLYELKDSLVGDSIMNALKPIDKYRKEYLASSVYYGDTLLKFKLNNEFAQRFLNADSAKMANSTNFCEFFYGFYITSDNMVGSSGVMYSLNFNNVKTKMEIAYHQQDTSHKSTSFSYYFTGNKFNHFSHNYSNTLGSTTYSIKSLNDTIDQDSVIYLKGLGGTYGRIDLDGFDEWSQKKNIAVNRAELIIEPESYSGLPIDSLVSKIYVFSTEYDNTKSIVAKYNKAKKYFSYDITFHLQSLLKGRIKNKSIAIQTYNISSSPAYAVLRSGSHSKRMRLIVTYTKL